MPAPLIAEFLVLRRVGVGIAGFASIISEPESSSIGGESSDSSSSSSLVILLLGGFGRRPLRRDGVVAPGKVVCCDDGCD